MKLFKGKSEPAPAAPPPIPAVSTPAPSAPAGPPVAEAPNDLQVVLDNSLKELNEKLSKLAQSVETVTEDRSSFEEKIGKMEERMRKLAVLTEMVSNQYNPFLGDGSKPNMAAPEGDDDPKESEAPPLPSFVPPAAPPAPEPAPPAKMEPVAPFAPPSSPAEAPAPRATPPALVPTAPLPRPDEEADEEREDSMWGSAHLTRVDNTFENHMLLLAWSNLLLKHADRIAISDLLRYYEEIGWIGERVRKQILGYTNGLRYEAPRDANPDADWRGNLELHERSLLFIEKLKGHGVNQENLAAMKRDVDRILGGRRGS